MVTTCSDFPYSRKALTLLIIWYINSMDSIWLVISCKDIYLFRIFHLFSSLNTFRRHRLRGMVVWSVSVNTLNLHISLQENYCRLHQDLVIFTRLSLFKVINLGVSHLVVHVSLKFGFSMSCNHCFKYLRWWMIYRSDIYCFGCRDEWYIYAIYIVLEVCHILFWRSVDNMKVRVGSYFRYLIRFHVILHELPIRY